MLLQKNTPAWIGITCIINMIGNITNTAKFGYWLEQSSKIIFNQQRTNGYCLLHLGKERCIDICNFCELLQNMSSIKINLSQHCSFRMFRVVHCGSLDHFWKCFRVIHLGSSNSFIFDIEFNVINKPSHCLVIHSMYQSVD